MNKGLKNILWNILYELIKNDTLNKYVDINTTLKNMLSIILCSINKSITDLRLNMINTEKVQYNSRM